MVKANVSGRFVSGLLIGAMSGIAAGLLVAPGPGRESRQIIRHKVGGHVDSLREKFKQNGTYGSAELSGYANVESSG